ncbi:MAG TPA: YafY family protein [Caulobacteraceae bacterium]|jgi:predicted DNA-binding transcriptional regulator YafY|nr:YafY family protein [Caulobacteraceae bacterium]
MRASRLLSILTTLQARGRVTAAELADEAEVSLRTIYRDIDALSAAGVPVYSERGSEGGYRLLDGYRTQLNGLSAREAEALFMIGFSGLAADLGLGAVMMAAQNKLLSAVPASMRAGAEQMRARFHLDAPAWFAEGEQPVHLPLVAHAVWDQKAIRIRYRSWRSERERRVEPLGLVLKGGSWYLAGQVAGDIRTYRIARILELTVLNESFERPAGFELETYWRANARRVEAELHAGRATVRLSPWGVRLLEQLTSPYVRSETRLEPETDAEGWRRAAIPVGSIRQACLELLRLGVEVEVLDPPELREKMAEVAAGLDAIYRRPDATDAARAD